MMRRVGVLFVALGLIASSTPLGAGEAANPADIQVTPLPRAGRVLVSFILSDIPEEVRDALHSGLPVTFTYDVELRRSAYLWLDRTLQWAVVTATVQYDNLTRRHQMTRTVDGRTEESKVTEDDQAPRHWLTEFKQLPLFSTRELEPNGEYYVRVRARTQPRVSWFLWPWDRGSASGHATFTFIP